MRVKKFNLYLADLNPRFGTEPGKTRPVVVIQTNLLNDALHPSTIVCPVTTRVVPEADLLRVHLSKKEAALKKDSDILVDQIRAIDNRRLVRHLGELSPRHRQKLAENLKILLFE
jgi:mRNA interferase MazF